MSLQPIVRGLQATSHLWEGSDDDTWADTSGVAMCTSRAQDEWEAATMMNQLSHPDRVSCRYGDTGVALT